MKLSPQIGEQVDQLMPVQFHLGSLAEQSDRHPITDKGG